MRVLGLKFLCAASACLRQRHRAHVCTFLLTVSVKKQRNTRLCLWNHESEFKSEQGGGGSGLLMQRSDSTVIQSRISMLIATGPHQEFHKLYSTPVEVCVWQREALGSTESECDYHWVPLSPVCVSFLQMTQLWLRLSNNFKSLEISDNLLCQCHMHDISGWVTHICLLTQNQLDV